MLAWTRQASAGCRPQDRLTSVPGPGRITVIVCVTAGSGLTRAACRPARMARVASRESGLAGSAAAIHADSVLPCRPGGQCGAGPGVPRYTAGRPRSGQAAGRAARRITGQAAGTSTLTPAKVTLRHDGELAAAAAAAPSATKKITRITRTEA